MPIYEPGLRELVSKNEIEGRLNFSTSISPEIDKSLLVFLAVGTPSKNDGSPNLDAIYKALDSIIPYVRNYKIFVLKSTVPIGTNNNVKEYLKKKLKTEFDVVSNPEFLKEGTAVQDFMKPDRIVVGSGNIKSQEIMKELYQHLTRNGHPILIMDSFSAETVKYACNLMLALKVSYINEVSLLCDAVGADIRRVREAIISDPRIGAQFLYPSIGYGGSCLPKDVEAVIHLCDEKKIDLSIPKATHEANKKQSQWFVKKINDYFQGNIKDKIFAVWGTAFKAGTDDIRESPSISLIEGLLSLGVRLRLYDPIALKNTKVYFEKSNFKESIEYAKNEFDSVRSVNALIVCTEWLQFRNPNFEKIAPELKDKVVFDGRNLYDPEKLKLYGLSHVGVGIPPLKKKDPVQY